jgi:hypothetical protein
MKNSSDFKTILFVITVLSSSLTIMAQVPATLITAPALEAEAAGQTTIMATAQASLAVIEATQKKIEEIKNKAEWINDLASIQEFISMLETIACMVRDLNINMGMYQNYLGPRASCFFDFQYRVNITKLRKSVDIINLVISDGFSMDRGARVQAYETAYENFVTSQVSLHRLDSYMRRKINQFEKSKSFKNSLFAANNLSTLRK